MDDESRYQYILIHTTLSKFESGVMNRREAVAILISYINRKIQDETKARLPNYQHRK